MAKVRIVAGFVTLWVAGCAGEVAPLERGAVEDWLTDAGPSGESPNAHADAGWQGADASVDESVDANNITDPEAMLAKVVGTGGIGLFVRSAASSDAEALGFIPETCIAELTGKAEGNWFELHYEGMTGWSHGGYLEPASVDAPQCDVPDATHVQVTGTGTLGLFMRSEPGSEHEILATIPEGCVAQLTGHFTDQWLQVTFDGKTGWSHKDYLQEVSANTQQCNLPSSSHVRVKGTGTLGLFMRSGPGSEHEVLQTIPEGCVGKLTGKFTDSWVELTYAGKTGWSHRDYLEEVSADTKQCSPPAQNSGLCSSSAPHCWPVNPQVISSGFGQRSSGFHGGVDFALPTGAAIYASKAGRVIHSGWHSSYGNYVKIDHGGGVSTLYAHMSVRRVSVGQQVSTSQRIGDIGSTGNSTGPHLHYEYRVWDSRKNPMGYLPR